MNLEHKKEEVKTMRRWILREQERVGGMRRCKGE
jgi:hypothetical protein